MMPSTTDAGPIARKILNSGKKLGLEQQEVVALAVPSGDARDESPAFAAYIHATNGALAIVEAMQDMMGLR